TDEVLKKDDRKASERHRTSLETMVTAVNALKESIEEKKFVNGEDEESVQEWSSGIEEIVNQADECMRELTSQIEQIDRNLKHASALHEHKREIELEREKLRQKQEAVERAHAEEDVKKIHEFYEKLLFNVESLQTLQSINKLDAAVRFTFDKLDVIKNELAMIDENWSEWTFVQFLEALEKWTINNPVQGVESSKTKAVATPYTMAAYLGGTGAISRNRWKPRTTATHQSRHTLYPINPVMC
ncbi:hypothetical protein P5673_019741, partial [Acropora cervicornis]